MRGDDAAAAADGHSFGATPSAGFSEPRARRSFSSL
jgi:hypothetical protein